MSLPVQVYWLDPWTRLVLVRLPLDTRLTPPSPPPLRVIFIDLTSTLMHELPGVTSSHVLDEFPADSRRSFIFLLCRKLSVSLIAAFQSGLHKFIVLSVCTSPTTSARSLFILRLLSHIQVHVSIMSGGSCSVAAGENRVCCRLLSLWVVSCDSVALMFTRRHEDILHEKKGNVINRVGLVIQADKHLNSPVCLI